MTNDQIKADIEAELDIQNLQDMKALLETPAGRRHFQWLIKQCGQNSTSFTRDSRTYFNEGMRNVALILEGSAKAMGLSGVELMHLSEKEYIILQTDIRRRIMDKKGVKP